MMIKRVSGFAFVILGLNYCFMLVVIKYYFHHEIELVENRRFFYSTSGDLPVNIVTVKHQTYDLLDGMDFDAETVLIDGNKIHGTVVMNFTELKMLKEEAHKCRHLKRLCELKTRRCSWCSHRGCVEGTMWLNGGIIQGESLRKGELEMYKTIERKFKEDIFVSNRTLGHRFNPLLFRCEMDQPITHGMGRGRFQIPFVKDMQKTNLTISTKLRAMPKVKNVSDDNTARMAVCGRGLYGEYDAKTITAQVEYYRSQQIEKVIMYDIGLVFIENRHLLQPYIDEGSLLFIDLRNFVQQLYGPLAPYILLRTFAVGQMWLKFDCMQRTKQMGFEWVLHVDLDEYLHLGVVGSSTGGTVRDAIVKHAEQGRQQWLSFGSLQNDQFAFDMTNLTKYVAQVEALHKMMEAPHGENYFKHDISVMAQKEFCKDYHLCLGSSGLRKLATRTILDPFALRVHRVAKSVSSLGKDLSTDDLYVRHYRHLNKI